MKKKGIYTWDHSSHREFYNYYAKASQGERTLQRIRSLRDHVLRIIGENQFAQRSLEVADIGCGAGTQSMIWAELGHHVYGLDINQPLVELARDRATNSGYTVDFQVGSAVDLPWEDESFDVCLVLELIEHVADWKTCIKEFARILRPGGVLVLTTPNKLCPIQQEFRLPFYSWYPGPVKRYFERLAVTTRPELANFAEYPAINWFSFYTLQKILVVGGFECFDRFDLIDLSNKNLIVKLIVSSIRAIRILRRCAHVVSPSTILMGVKRAEMPKSEVIISKYIREYIRIHPVGRSY